MRGGLSMAGTGATGSAAVSWTSSGSTRLTSTDGSAACLDPTSMNQSGGSAGSAFSSTGGGASTASASMMTDALKGRTVAEALRLFERFHELVTSDPSKAQEASAELGKLGVFAGVHEFPMRVKCATLAWHTMKAALEGGDEASTE